MKLNFIFVFVMTGVCSATFAGSRGSADYSVPADSTDAAGANADSENYSVNGSTAGEFGAGANALVTSAGYIGKNGYAGELYDIVALNISAPPSSTLNESASRQLSAAPMADDATTLALLDPSTVSWTVVSGPIASISTSGLATASSVYQDTQGSIGGSAQSLAGQFDLTIVNTNSDDFGAYAGDAIDDSWQVQFFGQPPNPLAGPSADADGTGQNNLFKFVAGLNPLDGSRFSLSIQSVEGELSQKQLIFEPLMTGRSYTVQFETGLTTTDWQTLVGTFQSDDGSQRTVTDTAAAAPRYYRVQISKP